MEKDSIFKIIYRFFDLIVLTYIVFDFGYSIHEEYHTPKFIGLVLITIALFAFNIFKYFYYKSKGRKKVAFVNSIIIGALLLISLVISIINIDSHLSGCFAKNKAHSRSRFDILFHSFG